MKTEFNYNNASNLVFHSFNQRKEKKYYYWCIVFAPIVNITMNCKITHNIDLTREDVDIIGERMIKAGKLNPKFGGKGLDGVNYVLSYIKEQVGKGRRNLNGKKWIIPNLSTFYNEDEKELLKWVDRGYMFIFGMGVNEEFVKDMIDGKLEKYEDYKYYKGNELKHFTNGGRWLRSKEKYGKEFICDSYAHNQYGIKWTYWNFDIKEAFEDIAFRSKYIFH